MWVQILAEAGLSECASAPDVPACKEFNDGFALFFGSIVMFPLALIAVCLWLTVTRRTVGSIRGSVLSRPRRRAWIAAALFLPLVGAAAWSAAGVPQADPPEHEPWSPTPEGRTR